VKNIITKQGTQLSCHLPNRHDAALESGREFKRRSPFLQKTMTLDSNHPTIKKDQMPLCVHSLAVISDEHSPCDLVVRLFLVGT
jgi:hypothetical protein